MIQHRLISIDHINQLIPALAAILHNRAGTSQLKPTIIFIKPHIKFSSHTFNHLKSMAHNFDPCIIIEGASLIKYKKLMLNLPVTIRAKLFKKKLASYAIDEIYYAHDVSSDFWNQVLMQCYPKANRVCFGDALGLVYSQNYFTNLMYKLDNKTTSVFLNLLGRIKRKLIYPRKKNQLLPQQYVLALPCDPGGDVLKTSNLSIIHRNTLQKAVRQLAESMTLLKNYKKDQVNHESQKHFLLILSNLTESKLTTIENEIKLYQEILQLEAKNNDKIIIKPHPAFQPDILNKIVSALSNKYDVAILDKQFFQIPIELAEDLIKSCNILSISYSSISIPYIYEKEVKHVLTNDLIHRYFNYDRIQWSIESNELYVNLIQALKHWDQNSIISSERIYG